MDEIGNDFEIYFKSSFSSPMFFGYQVTSSYNFQKNIFDTKLYFSHFQFFSGGRRKKDSLDSNIERKLSLMTIPFIKTVNFCVKQFHMMKGVQFFFIIIINLENTL